MQKIMLKYWTNNEHKFWHLDTPEFTYYKHKSRARMDLEISVLKVLHPHSSTSNHISERLGTQNPGFGFLECNWDMGLRQVEQGFSSFFAKCLAYLIIFQSFTAPSGCSTLKNHQICQKFGKEWRKALFNLP